jgi:hypothetical protein
MIFGRCILLRAWEVPLIPVWLSIVLVALRVARTARRLG